MGTGVVSTYLELYAGCMRKAVGAVARNAWTLLLPAAILAAREWAGRLAAPLGMAGGIVVSLATAALFSCYLYFVGELARGGRVALKELGLKLRRLLLGGDQPPLRLLDPPAVRLLLGGRAGTALEYALGVVALVALNAVPEVIHSRGTHGGLHTIAESWAFLQAQWIPWFAVNVPLFALLVLGVALLAVPFAGVVLFGAAVHVVMAFRGVLFRALDGSSHRQRMFSRRAA